jgi:multimeric flavodoxin WrbA
MDGDIKFLILNGTLKLKDKFSHTRTLCEFLMPFLNAEGAEGEIVDLVEYQINPGVETHEGEGDEWPEILNKVLEANIIIFATPIWWGTHSSITQRIIERMDALNDELLETGKSELANKVGGIVISGAEDGAENIIGQICNFLVWNGVTIPPACSLSYLGEYAGTKDALLEQFKKSKPVSQMAETMSRNLVYLARLLRANPIPQKN